MSSKDNDKNTSSNKTPYDTDDLPKIGNTLDYYNDVMSKNAVSRLFDGEFSNLEEDKGPAINNDDKSPSRKKAAELIKSTSKSENARQTPHGSFPANSDTDSDDIVVFDKADSSTAITDMTDDKIRNNRKSATAKFFDDDLEETQSKPSRRVVTAEAEEGSSISKKERSQPKKFVYDDDIESEDEDDEVIRPSRRTSSRVRSVPEDSSDDDDDDYYDDDDYNPKGLLTFSIGGISILLLILTYLVFQVSSLNKEIDVNLTQLAEYTSIRQDYESLKIENDGLSQQIASLNSQIQSVNNGNNSSASTDTTASSGTSSGTSGDLPEPEPTIYTVKSGDTLSSISSAMYGVSSEYDKIKTANGLTSDTLKVGQKLVIPY